jgi:thioredoxin-like negative regulator of GroEL
MLENLSKEYAGRIKVIKVNVDENPGLSQQFQATSIPTMLVIKDGRVVDRIVGALPPNDLKMRLFPYLMKT